MVWYLIIFVAGLAFGAVIHSFVPKAKDYLSDALDKASKDLSN